MFSPAVLMELPHNALPPFLPIVAETVHTLGWLLLVAVVSIPALVLAASAWREAGARREGQGGRGRKGFAGRLLEPAGDRAASGRECFC